VIHPLDPEDVSAIAQIRIRDARAERVRWRIDARKQFDALMEAVSPRTDVTFESAAVGGVPGLWIHPASSRSDEAICIYTVGGSAQEAPGPIATWFGHIAARAGTRAFVRTIDLLPSILFLQRLMTCWRRTAQMDDSGYAGLPSTGDSAEEIWRWYLPSCVAAKAVPVKTILVGAAALSPVTDLTLSGAT